MELSSTVENRHTTTDEMQLIFEKQRIAFNAQPYPDYTNRRHKLIELKKQIIRYQDAIATAINTDFDSRSFHESKLLDILGSVLETQHAIRHLCRWMKPSKRHTELLFLSNRLEVQYQPKGVIGIIVPWNFPVYLALGPLVAAIAAGNRVMIKLSEFTPTTNAKVKQMLSEIFSEDEVAVFGEEIQDPSKFTSLAFNHIVFTGSPAVGHIVMRTAAENLTPVTLELGGKSPALVTRNYDITDAAKRILHGKATNSGQICVSPDYALIPKENIDSFISACKNQFTHMFGQNIDESPHYTSIINERHLKRIQAILQDAQDKGAQIITCADYNAEHASRRMPVQLVINCTPDMRIMQEELFGPILPIIAYDTLEQAIQYIQKHERPLALYCFTLNTNERDHILKNTHSGGVTVNDWGWHVVNHDAPFGGIGNSGMGTYHGIEGFRELSHTKTVLHRHRFFPTQLFYPPYGTFIQKMILRFFLKKGDPNI